MKNYHNIYIEKMAKKRFNKSVHYYVLYIVKTNEYLNLVK